MVPRIFVRFVSPFIVGVMGFSLSLAAAIQEAPSLATVQAAIVASPGITLVAFDLDNTVMSTKQMLGSDQWYSFMKQAFEKQGDSEAEAIRKAIALWEKVQRKTQVTAVEGNQTVEGILAIQSLPRVKVMGLTARPVGLIATTLQQLHSIGVTLNHAPVTTQSQAVTGKGFKGPARYESGILFVGPENNKGTVLLQFLKQIHLSPTQVHLVDDKLHHVEALEKTFVPLKVPYLGFRYGAADADVQSFDFAVSEIERQEFEKTGKLLSDAEARQRIH